MTVLLAVPLGTCSKNTFLSKDSLSADSQDAVGCCIFCDVDHCHISQQALLTRSDTRFLILMVSHRVTTLILLQKSCHSMCTQVLFVHVLMI